MNTSIAALKRSKSNLDTLVSELNKVAEPQKQKNSYADDRFWKPELDKSGNGYAVFRFLPAVKGEDLPWARLWSHAFQGPGGWFIENSLTTMNKKDPVSESARPRHHRCFRRRATSGTSRNRTMRPCRSWGCPKCRH